MQSIVGKTILITGGGSGIGQGAALYLASKGANVVITGRTEANLQQIAAKAPAGKVLPLVGDVISESDWKHVVSEAVAKFGGIDMAVMNAGSEGPDVQDLVDVNVAEIKQLLAVNILGPILGAKYCVPALLKSKGTLVLVSSLASALPRTTSGFPLYGPTKSACDALVRQFSALYSPRGIRVFGVNPGVYESAMLRKTADMPAFRQVAGSAEGLGDLFNPLGAIGDPVDFGVVFQSILTDTKYTSGDCIAVFAGPTPGKPLTFEMSYLYTNLTGSSAPDAFHKCLLSLPLHDAKGSAFAPSENAEIQAAIKAHVTNALSKLAAAQRS